MIFVNLRFDVSRGKREEARDWCRRLASYRKQQAGVEDSFMIRPHHGPISIVTLVTKFSSLTAWDEFRKKLKDDPEWKALRKETEDKGYFSSSPERFVYDVIE